MKKRIIIGAVAVTLAVALLSVTAEARRGSWAGKAKASTTQTVRQPGVCPLGYAPGSCPGQGRGAGFGPGDCKGNRGIGPRDGSGYGAKAFGRGNLGAGRCDGTGPKGFPRGSRLSR